jgi:hypothetical protein
VSACILVAVRHKAVGYGGLVVGWEGGGVGGAAAVPLRQVAPALRLRPAASESMNHRTDAVTLGYPTALQPSLLSLVKILLFGKEEKSGGGGDQRHNLETCYY